ncbi:hypothetical protein EVAR_69923_1 [Eumeta japonica]|uniref:Uncharacterized protein n=1 Tax=Eumeta variegata TaxID=151549 RepID=A0A4C1TBX4_EUMVA|nr:hypothetical protein EVAR_69923_1 [Eumeta japonica]
MYKILKEKPSYKRQAKNFRLDVNEIRDSSLLRTGRYKALNVYQSSDSNLGHQRRAIPARHQTTPQSWILSVKVIGSRRRDLRAAAADYDAAGLVGWFSC